MPWPMYIAQADVYECTLLFSESGFSAGDAIMKREKKKVKTGVVWCVLGRDMWWCAFHLIFMGACFGGAWCFFEQCCLQRLFRGGGDCLATSRWHFFPLPNYFPNVFRICSAWSSELLGSVLSSWSTLFLSVRFHYNCVSKVNFVIRLQQSFGKP